MITRAWFRRKGSKARCREVRRVIHGYIDGELEEGFEEKIAEHLEDCRRCGLAADVYTRIKESLQAHPPTVDNDAIERLREFGSNLGDDP